MNNTELIKKVLAHNSSQKNMICCVEEMSELTKVLTKYLRESPKFNRDNLIEEVGHVLLMCNVVANYFDVGEEDINLVWEHAVERMYDNKK